MSHDGNRVSRRDFFRAGAKIAGVAGAFLGSAGVGAVCVPTPKQGLGPFYPERDLNRDQDLTYLDPKKGRAEGTVIELSGVIQDAACKPVTGALVEVWQANKYGKYDHSKDFNPLKKDPNFQHWGRCTTTADGKYLFRTIIPGHYPLDPSLVGKEPNGEGQFRPPHIHMKIQARGFEALVTQVYFDPRTYDDKGLAKTVQALNEWERVDRDLLVRYVPDSKDVSLPLRGSFDVTLIRR